MRTSKRDSILQAALPVVETDGVTAVTDEATEEESLDKPWSVAEVENLDKVTRLVQITQKPIALEKGLRTFEDTEVSRREVVASEAGYELEFDVWPEALFSRVKRIGLEPTEHSDKPVIFAGQLDQDDMFTVHSPRPLPLAKFVTIDGRQKIKELARTSRTTQSVTSLAVPNAALANAVRKQPSAELFLMWSTLSYEDYLDSLPAGEREAYNEAQAKWDNAAAELNTVLATISKTVSQDKEGHSASGLQK